MEAQYISLLEIYPVDMLKFFVHINFTTSKAGVYVACSYKLIVLVSSRTPQLKGHKMAIIKVVVDCEPSSPSDNGSSAVEFHLRCYHLYARQD